jgi:hypothetical protein
MASLSPKTESLVAECCERYPLVKKVVQQFRQWNVGAHFGDVNDLYMSRKALKLLQEHDVAIRWPDEFEFGEEEAPRAWDPFVVDPGEAVAKYTRRTALAAIARSVTLHAEKADDALSKLRQHFSDAVIEHMVESIGVVRVFPGDPMDFAQAVEALGQENPDIWRYQRQYPRASMMYLSLYPEDLAVAQCITGV